MSTSKNMESKQLILICSAGEARQLSATAPLRYTYQPPETSALQQQCGQQLRSAASLGRRWLNYCVALPDSGQRSTEAHRAWRTSTRVLIEALRDAGYKVRYRYFTRQYPDWEDEDRVAHESVTDQVLQLRIRW